MEIGYHEEVKKVVKTLKDTKPDMRVSLREVYLLLTQHAQICDSSATDDRVAFVSDFLLRSKCGGNKLYDATHCSDHSIINQAMKLNAEFPNMDALTIWELLETNDGNPVQVVRDRLIELSQHSSSVEVPPEASFCSPSDALLRTCASPQGNKRIPDVVSSSNTTPTIQYRLPVTPDPDTETSQDHLSAVSNTNRISHCETGVNSSPLLATKMIQNASKMSSIPIKQTPTISRIGEDRFTYKTDSPSSKTKPLQSNDPGISSTSLARRTLLSTTPSRVSSFTSTNSIDAGHITSNNFLDIKHSKTWSLTEVKSLRQQSSGQDIKHIGRTSSIPLATKTQPESIGVTATESTLPDSITEAKSTHLDSVSSRPSSPPNVVAPSEGDAPVEMSLVLDASIIFSMFPDRDHNEIYSLVEAYCDFPDRVPIVIEKMLGKAPPNGKKSAKSSSPAQSSWRSSHPLPSELTTPVLTGKTPKQLGDLLNEIDHLCDIFPDCDPNYFLQRLQGCSSSDNRVQTIAADISKQKTYPLLNDVLQSMAKERENRRLMALDLTVEDFLAKFPNSEESFACSKKMEDNYTAHVTVQLYYDYPEFPKTFKDAVMKKNRFHLLPCVRELDAMKEKKKKESTKYRCKSRNRFLLRYPDKAEERFFCELWYIRNKEKVHEHLAQKTKDRREKLEKAKAEGNVFKCSCCSNEDLLLDDVKMCDDGHLFCHECICRSVKAGFDEGKTSFPCLSGHCSLSIPLTALKDALPSSLLSEVLHKLQEEEVRQAGLPNLVECPFCSFATIMDDPENTVFRCLNPDCLKDSCRLCREPNHVPFKCVAVETQNEMNMRTFIEKKLNEAMIRKCHVCGRRFIKEVGCNKMTCVCGATSCYACQAPNINYDHFRTNCGLFRKRCSDNDMGLLNKMEMKFIARDAKQEYLQLHPEAPDTVLESEFDAISGVDTFAAVEDVPRAAAEAVEGVGGDHVQVELDQEEAIPGQPSGDSKPSSPQVQSEDAVSTTFNMASIARVRLPEPEPGSSVKEKVKSQGTDEEADLTANWLKSEIEKNNSVIETNRLKQEKIKLEIEEIKARMANNKAESLPQ